MKTKKSEALALELIDDLLDEEESEDKTSSSQSKKKKSLDQVSNKETQKLDASQDEEDKTQKIEPPQNLNDQLPSADAKTVGSQRPERAYGGPVSATELALAQSKNLQIAQEKILQLEEEVERLRVENEELAAAGDIFKNRVDELQSQVENASKKASEQQDTLTQEKEILLKSLEKKDQQVQQLQLEKEQLEARLTTNIKKIRVRERELENRLELVKLENQALARNKDELILDLKRQLDKAVTEMETYRQKGQEFNKQLENKEDLLRRTVRALRLALSMLEGEASSQQNEE